MAEYKIPAKRRGEIVAALPRGVPAEKAQRFLAASERVINLWLGHEAESKRVPAARTAWEAATDRAQASLLRAQADAQAALDLYDRLSGDGAPRSEHYQALAAVTALRLPKVLKAPPIAHRLPDFNKRFLYAGLTDMFRGILGERRRGYRPAVEAVLRVYGTTRAQSMPPVPAQAEGDIWRAISGRLKAAQEMRLAEAKATKK